MGRRVFYSFHYEADNWRASQIRNIGVVEGNRPISDNDWEKLKRGGANGIRMWIDGQLYHKSCTIVLVGTATAGRKWIEHEILESWNQGMGILGINIHNLKNREGSRSQKGKNPFESIYLGRKCLANAIKLYEPPTKASKEVYSYIEDHLESWVEKAIEIRKKF
jgi:hypothetical protein